MPHADVRGATHSMADRNRADDRAGSLCHLRAWDESTEGNARVFEAPTNSIFFGIRLLSTDEARREKDLAAIKIYPLSKISSPPETKVINVNRRPWEGWQPRGLAYFERLADILGREPVAERDRFSMAMLKPLGIEKGKPFKPNERQKRILTEAALVGEAMAKANDFFNPRLEQSHYVDNSNWEVATVSPPDKRMGRRPPGQV
jgi:hypothetical protein